MKAMKIKVNIEPKEGFKIEEFINTVRNSLAQFAYECIAYKYFPKSYNTAPEFPMLNRCLDTIIYYVSIPRHFDYRVVLGDLFHINSEKYPMFEIYSINPTIVEIKGDEEHEI